jgi:SRSO17 transposase
MQRRRSASPASGTGAPSSADGRQGALHADFAWVRVWAGYGRQAGRTVEDEPDPEPRWLLVEWRAGDTIKYALFNLPPETPIKHAVALCMSRWQVEQGYQQLKDELGLEHFEGRSWAGLHHHALLTMIAFAFLQHLQLRQAGRLAAPYGEPPPQPTLPAIRQLLLRWLSPDRRCP